AAPTSTLYQVPANATATPTPFQPLPPTPALFPTLTPLPTATSLPPTPTQIPPKVKAAQEPSLAQPARQMNILLLGSDKRPWDSNFRTDTIILATLNPDLGTVNLTSFPRDLWVTLPNYGQQRINTAWEFGGWNLLAKTFEYNFGVRPDHYVLLNFSSFKHIVDSLGGLDVDVKEPMSDYRAGVWTTFPAGMTHMDADDVLWYVRSRKTSNDFARNKRQHEVLEALFNKMLSLNAIQHAPEFYNIYKESVITDLGLSDLITWLPFGATLRDTSHIKSYYIGPQQVYDWITPDGAMVLLPNQDAISDIIRQALNLP
ncbi:MAG TPA: LCP family protein, partial [Anaerolineales bacterium]